MKVLGFRFCTVSPEASHLASFLDALGFERHPLEGGDSGDSFTGAVFAAGESWLAMWPPSEHMRPGMMLQVVVDDADAFAARAREQGLNPTGPAESQGKRIYFIQAPTGLQISIQSRLAGHTQSMPVPGPPPPPARGNGASPSGPPPAPARVNGAPPAAAAKNAAAPPATAAKKVQTVRVPPADKNVPAPPAAARGKGMPAPPAVARPRTMPNPPPPGVRAMSIPVPPAGVFRRASAAEGRRPKS
jgi:hypothetical protein